jgi:hypothetical protein
MRYFTLVIFIILGTQFPVLSQQYDHSIGLRLGGSSGFTARWQFTEYIGLVEMQRPGLAEFGDGLFWYYGVGAHIGYYSGYRHYDSDHRRRHGGGLALGPDAIIGVVYYLENLPLSVSLDYKPYIDILRFRHFFDGFDDFALSVRYIF